MTYTTASQSNALSILISVLSSSAISVVLGHYFGKKKDSEIEQLKDALAKGSHISRSQFDLEVEAYKNLWAQLSALNLTARSLRFSEVLIIQNPKGVDHEWRDESFSEALEKFSQAHNEALATGERFAPFYPASIRDSVSRVTTVDLSIMNHIADLRKQWFSQEWNAELKVKIEDMEAAVDQVEAQIRLRLESLKIV